MFFLFVCLFVLHVGGSVLHADCCSEPGSADSIIHELGHNLGLWHVHEGVSGMDCSDECYEKEPSLGKTHGYFISIIAIYMIELKLPAHTKKSPE